MWHAKAQSREDNNVRAATDPALLRGSAPSREISFDEGSTGVSGRSEYGTFNRKPIGVRAGERCLYLPRSNARTPIGLRLNVNGIWSLLLTSPERRISLDEFSVPSVPLCFNPNSRPAVASEAV